MSINIKECVKAGLDPKEVQRIARNLSKYVREAETLGISLFGGTGNGTLRFHDEGRTDALILADLDGIKWDGGDGGTSPDEEGYLRGEK